MTLQPSGSPHFPGLNALRFYAALSVVVYHSQVDFAELHPHPSSLRWLQTLVLHGYDSVILFFVLSGFLIASLAIHEQRSTGTLAVGRFYVRRALRIWPLYYGLLFVGLFAIPSLIGPLPAYHPRVTGAQVALMVLLLPNWAGLPMIVAHLWSLGVEEQFYALYPVLARLRRWIVPLLVGLILLKLVVSVIAYGACSDSTLALWSVWLPHECIAIGALGAYLYARPRPAPLLRVFYRRSIQILLWAVFLGLVVMDSDFTLSIRNQALSFVFLGIILNVATNPASLIKLRHPLLERLGDLSYGMYIWHVPIMYGVLLTLQALGWRDGFNELSQLATIGLTLWGAWLSRRYIEMPFLRLKRRFQTQPSPSPSSIANEPAPSKDAITFGSY